MNEKQYHVYFYDDNKAVKTVIRFANSDELGKWVLTNASAKDYDYEIFEVEKIGVLVSVNTSIIRT